ncbi:MAG TPA: nitroreductase family protein, partial [Spirochaetia bacterium]|nr:nitroreductase family protein [Spirochaetia bacterium]
HRFTVLTRGQTRTVLMGALLRIYRRRSRLLNSALLRVLARPVSGPVTREFLRDREYGPRIRNLIGRLAAGEDPIFYGAPVVVLIHSGVRIPTPKEDCVLAGFVLSLAALEAGIGACFVTLGQSAINASARCKRILGLPAAEQVHAVVVLGYPVGARQPPSRREVREIRYV